MYECFTYAPIDASASHVLEPYLRRKSRRFFSLILELVSRPTLSRSSSDERQFIITVHMFSSNTFPLPLVSLLPKSNAHELKHLVIAIGEFCFASSIS